MKSLLAGMSELWILDERRRSMLDADSLFRLSGFDGISDSSASFSKRGRGTATSAV
jgi:hypothetical protein